MVCILREDNFGKHGLIDYNFHCFRQAIQEVRLLFDKGILIVIHGRVENALSLKGRELNPFVRWGTWLITAYSLKLFCR